jgi:hypothetical protein
MGSIQVPLVSSICIPGRGGHEPQMIRRAGRFCLEGVKLPWPRGGGIVAGVCFLP